VNVPPPDSVNRSVAVWVVCVMPETLFTQAPPVVCEFKPPANIAMPASGPVVNSSILAIRGTLILVDVSAQLKVAGSKISAVSLVVNARSPAPEGHVPDVAVIPPATNTSPEGSTAIPGSSRATFIGLAGAHDGPPS
jgi:hypothetical protein